MVRILGFVAKVMQKDITSKVLVAFLVLPWAAPISAQPITHADAAHAAIHPVATPVQMQTWLARVPATHDFPPDFTETLASAAPFSAIEMTTSAGRIPCGDLWTKLGLFHARYHWQVRVISREEAMLRSGRLGLPWVGHPVAWVRPLSDQTRTIPIAIGTDHLVNISRNAYLATKMLSGVKPDVALRAMAKYTGIVGASATQRRRGS